MRLNSTQLRKLAAEMDKLEQFDSISHAQLRVITRDEYVYPRPTVSRRYSQSRLTVEIPD